MANKCLLNLQSRNWKQKIGAMGKTCCSISILREKYNRHCLSLKLQIHRNLAFNKSSRKLEHTARVLNRAYLNFCWITGEERENKRVLTAQPPKKQRDQWKSCLSLICVLISDVPWIWISSITGLAASQPNNRFQAQQHVTIFREKKHFTQISYFLNLIIQIT